MGAGESWVALGAGTGAGDGSGGRTVLETCKGGAQSLQREFQRADSHSNHKLGNRTSLFIF